jgi:hypothetical protein
MLFNVHVEEKCVHKCDFLLLCCLCLQNMGHMQFFNNVVQLKLEIMLS